MSPSERRLLDRADFEELFADEPAPPPVEDDLGRGRRAARRRRTRIASAGVTVLVLALVAAVSATVLLGRPRYAAPADPASPRSAAPSPLREASPTPTPPTTTDTAPPLRYSSRLGYLDRRGQGLDAGPGRIPFQATTRNSWTLVRELFDPGHRHLEPYSPGLTGGRDGDGEMVGEKFGWTTKGQHGEAMLLVSVTRPLPGHRPTIGVSGMGQCAGDFTDVSTCRPTTIGGHRVWLGTLSDGGFVIDYVQPDGEVAGIVVDPLFGNNSSIPLDSVPISRADAVRLLADPRLDVIG